MQKYIKKILYIFIFSTIACTNMGCAVLLLGTGAAGGYAITQDTVESFTERDFNKVWKKVDEILEREGSIILRDETQGLIKAVVQKSEVEVLIEKLTEDTVRVRIKARKLKAFFPNLKLAQSIHSMIIGELHQ